MTAPRILLVDDDPAERELMAIAQAEFAPDLALTAVADLTAAAAALAAGAWRLVLTDLHLGRERGTGLLRHPRLGAVPLQRHAVAPLHAL